MNWNAMNDTATLKEGEQVIVKAQSSLTNRTAYTIGTSYKVGMAYANRDVALPWFTNEWCNIKESAEWREMSTIDEAPPWQPILMRYIINGNMRYRIEYKSLGGDIDYPTQPAPLGWMMLSDNLGAAI